MKRRFLIFALFGILFCFSSCKVELNLKLLETGSVEINFAGGAGAAFSKMILSSSGGDENFNIDEITLDLAKSGFEDIKVEANGIKNVKIKMLDKNQNTFLFSSGLLEIKDKHFILNLNRKNIKAFYDTCDEQLQMLLDLFLAPVFNDEEMSEDEYIEMLGTFYGEPAAAEVKDSFINITLQHSDGENIAVSITMAEFLCTN